MAFASVVELLSRRIRELRFLGSMILDTQFRLIHLSVPSPRQFQDYLWIDVQILLLTIMTALPRLTQSSTKRQRTLATGNLDVLVIYVRFIFVANGRAGRLLFTYLSWCTSNALSRRCWIFIWYEIISRNFVFPWRTFIVHNQLPEVLLLTSNTRKEVPEFFNTLRLARGQFVISEYIHHHSSFLDASSSVMVVFATICVSYAGPFRIWNDSAWSALTQQVILVYYRKRAIVIAHS